MFRKIKISLSLFFIFSCFSFEAQGQVPVVIYHLDICNCKVYIKNGAIETLFTGNIIPVNMINNKTKIKVHYSNDTLSINVEEEEKCFIKNLRLFECLELYDGQPFVYSEANYEDDGELISISKSILMPLK